MTAPNFFRSNHTATKVSQSGSPQTLPAGTKPEVVLAIDLTDKLLAKNERATHVLKAIGIQQLNPSFSNPQAMNAWIYSVSKALKQYGLGISSPTFVQEHAWLIQNISDTFNLSINISTVNGRQTLAAKTMPEKPAHLIIDASEHQKGYEVKVLNSAPFESLKVDDIPTDTNIDAALDAHIESQNKLASRAMLQSSASLQQHAPQVDVEQLQAQYIHDLPDASYHFKASTELENSQSRLGTLMLEAVTRHKHQVEAKELMASSSLSL